MDFFENPLNVLSIASVIVVMLFHVNVTLQMLTENIDPEESVDNADTAEVEGGTACSAVDSATRAAIHHFLLFTSLAVIDDDLGFWVKPSSTTWFTKFLLEEYDNERWMQMFRMTKRSLFTLTHLLVPYVHKQDTKYRLVVSISIRIACTLFKLSHGASLLVCSELFAVGRSTVSNMLRKVVHAVNNVMRNKMRWPSDDILSSIATRFKIVYGLLGVIEAIDGTHIGIGGLQLGASDYCCFKSGGYTINCKAVIDCDKRFLDMYASIPSSTNNAWMLRRSTLYYRGQH